ncbi:MAG: histidine phosphatase family protein [Chloroflexota bacterium]
MTEIILVRHGETEWNVAEIFRGRLDIALNETGLRQAELLARELSGWKLAAVYSSPLKRALQTAEPIARYHELVVKTSPGLTDLNFGEWQGRAREEVKNKYPQIYTEWIESPHKVRVPGGESLDEVRERATRLVEEVVAQHQGTVVLVSHRVITKVLICALLGLDNSRFWNIRHDNCGVTIFDYRKGRFILNRHNDTSFLAPAGRLADF